jgi:Tfp pilus assembly protein PilN
MSQQINLYNPLFEKKEQPFSARTMSQALALIAVGVATMHVYAAYQARSAERVAAQLGQQIIVQREQVATLSKAGAPTRSKALETEIARLEAEVKTRQTTLQALNTGELGNTAGFSEFLAALGRQTMPGIWLSSITIANSGNDLVVQGRALRADLMPAFLRALNSEPMMRGRRVTELKLSAKSPTTADKAAAVGYIEFSLTAPLQVADAATGTGGPQ